MGGVLDSILVKEMIDTPITVNLDFSTEGISIDDREDEFSVQVNYDGGVTVDMDIHVEVSNDNISYSSVGLINITDNTGSNLYDLVGGSGTRYMRVTIIVNTGSIVVQRILYSAKRRH